MLTLLADVVLLLLLAAVVWIDWRHLLIPDGLNAAILAAGTGALLLTGTPSPLSAGLAAACGAGALWLVRAAVSKRVGREAMGLGDVKFAAAAGVWVGLAALPAMLLVASLAGLAYGGLRRTEPHRRIPFGPFLALGALAARWMDRAGVLG